MKNTQTLSEVIRKLGGINLANIAKETQMSAAYVTMVCQGKRNNALVSSRAHLKIQQRIQELREYLAIKGLGQ